MKIIMTHLSPKTKRTFLFTVLAILLIPAVTILCVQGLNRSSDSSVATAGGASACKDWGLGFGKEGEQPTGNAAVKELLQYDTFYMGSKDQKVLYLTFDCGYENGNTAAILDALKKHNAPATFFVVGHFLESAPELVKRMVAEGHTVGNHTYHHPNMSTISDETSFAKELNDVRAKYKEITGTDMVMYYRPPQGKYNLTNLKMAQNMGYKTFFWSLAYVDWNQDSQPTREEALNKLTKRVHPGAVVLLHNTSKTNGQILDELLTKWEGMGYTFLPLSSLTESYSSPSSASSTANAHSSSGTAVSCAAGN